MELGRSDQCPATSAFRWCDREIFNRVSEDYRIFNVNITTDSNTYKNAPCCAQRVRIIVLPPTSGMAAVQAAYRM